MDRKLLEEKYINNGLSNFKLKTLDDLKKVHDVDYMIKGFDKLSEEQKNLYQKFLVNFYNAFGLDARQTMKPRKVQYMKKDGYLRFDYFIVGSSGWMHVYSENSWG